MARRRSKGGLNFNRKRRHVSSTVVREIGRWLFLEFTAVLIAFVLAFSFGMRTSVIGVSMEPTLFNGQEILINRFVYNIMSPRRNDVVVFLPGGTQNSHYYVKRVVGLPGERVQIRDSRLYINGILAEEGDKYDNMADAGIAENELTLGNDEYFVLGDNRNNSEDSRSANIGLVKKASVVGKAWYHMASSGDGLGFVR